MIKAPFDFNSVLKTLEENDSDSNLVEYSKLTIISCGITSYDLQKFREVMGLDFYKKIDTLVLNRFAGYSNNHYSLHVLLYITIIYFFSLLNIKIVH